jgi:hypothetical protein
VVAPHVLRAGVDMIENVTSGKKWKDAAMEGIPEAVRRIRIPEKPAATATLSTADNLLENTREKYLTKPIEQTGSGKRRRKSVARKCVKRDIFD